MHRDETDATPMQQRRKTDMRPRYHHSEPTLNISREPQVYQTSTDKIKLNFVNSSLFISFKCQMCQLYVSKV